MSLIRIGFMQGRLSPLVDGKIQAFPWEHWRDEFPIAESLGLSLMEWTLDYNRLAQNPLMTGEGRAEIRSLSKRHGVSVQSLTGDIFMQKPFWKVRGEERAKRLAEFEAVGDACAELGIRYIVVPLVDNGATTCTQEEDDVVTELVARAEWLRQRGLIVAFESDYAPQDLGALIARFPFDVFGINYDIGNSAALGYNYAEELSAYYPWIRNVHVKDRMLGGSTVPLGEGGANFPATIGVFVKRGYGGNFIMQTARAENGDHAGALAKYSAMIEGWIEGV